MFLDYGQKANHVLLPQYGFVRHPNPDEFVEIRYDFSPPVHTTKAGRDSGRLDTMSLTASTHFEQHLKQVIAVEMDLDEASRFLDTTRVMLRLHIQRIGSPLHPSAK